MSSNALGGGGPFVLAFSMSTPSVQVVDSPVLHVGTGVSAPIPDAGCCHIIWQGTL